MNDTQMKLAPSSNVKGETLASSSHQNTIVLMKGCRNPRLRLNKTELRRESRWKTLAQFRIRQVESHEWFIIHIKIRSSPSEPSW